MSFAVQLADDLCRVEPGATVPVSFEVVNRSDTQDRYEIEVEGLDPSWIAMPVSTFVVEPRETHLERFFLKPPRDSESLAGTYPYVVNIRSTESGESRSVQGALEIQAYSNLSIDVQPKRGRVSPTSKTTQFQVTVINLGNGEQNLQMYAADNDSMFAYEFDADQVALGPGQQRTLILSAAATKSSLLASSRLQNFSVSARSLENAGVAAKATGQIEQRALATPGTFLLMLLVLGAIAAWAVLFPKPPILESINVQPTNPVVGQPVQITWRAARATSVTVTVGNWVQDRQAASGTLTYVPDKAGDFAVEILMANGDMKTKDMSKTISVSEPPVVPMPVIVAFTSASKQVNVGQSFMLQYKFGESVTRAVLYPMQRDLDVKANEIQLLAEDAPGKVKYTVKAFNSANQSVEASVTVTVVKPSKAKILQFEVAPTELEETGGTVGIDFTTVNAARIVLTYSGTSLEIKNGIDPNAVSNQDRGHREVVVTADTTFKLIAYDDEDVSIGSATVTVKVKKPPAGEGAPDTPTTGGGGR